MSRFNCRILLAFVALSVVGFTAVAQAELLFSDNFDNANCSDGNNGLNDNLTNRQGGSLVKGVGGSVINWARAKNMTSATSLVNNTDAAYGAANTLMTIAPTDTGLPSVGVLIQHNFNDAGIVSAGGLTIRFDADPASLGSTGTNHAIGGGAYLGAKDGTESNISTGTSAAARCNGYDSKVDFGVQLRDDGVGSVWDSGTWQVNGTGACSTTFDETGGPTPNWTKWYTFEVRVDLSGSDTPFAAGEFGYASLYYGPQGTPSNQLVKAGFGAPATDGTYKFTWDADGNNYIGFGACAAYNFPMLFDNVSIYSGAGNNNYVPEPSTLALLACGLIGLLAYAWRKRK